MSEHPVPLRPEPAASALALWRPLTRDPVLLAERVGRWHLIYAILGTIACALLAVALLSIIDHGLETLANRTGTRAAYDRAGEPNVFFLPGNVYTFLNNALFGVALIAVATALAALHLRSPGYFWRYHGPGGAALFFKTAAAMIVVTLAGSAYEYIKNPASFALRTDFGRIYLLSVAAGIGALLLQTLGEEAVFRGYLLRVWGALVPIRAAMVAALVTGFTMLHTVNSDFRTDFMFNFIGFLLVEVIYYWVLFRTGSLAATWGLHFANNLLAGILVITVPGSAPDMGLFVFTDPVLSAGGTRLKSPTAYIELGLSMSALVVLLSWRRSPFHLAEAPLPAIPEPPQPAPVDVMPSDVPASAPEPPTV
ncbi:MAG: CPBP family intramembrane glutamic endopeptidase [Hyphomicrobiaceae bacterium]